MEDKNQNRMDCEYINSYGHCILSFDYELPCEKAQQIGGCTYRQRESGVNYYNKRPTFNKKKFKFY